MVRYYYTKATCIAILYSVYGLVVIYALFAIVYSALTMDKFEEASLTPLHSNTTAYIVDSFKNHSYPIIEDLMYKRLHHLHQKSKSAVLVHFHVPKAGGSALSLALTTECTCNFTTSNKQSELCQDCKKVIGRLGSSPYSVSRFNAWEYGVHTPLDILNRRARRILRRIGLIAVMVVSIREPFHRFLSESLSMAKGKFFSSGWSAKTHKRIGVAPLFADDVPPLLAYANLPLHFIIQNRQTKMIGGVEMDFDMGFALRERIGSMWRPNDTLTSIQTVKERAKRILLTFPYQVLCIHERLEDSLCVLEIVYGHLYRFRWDSSRHSHNAEGHFTVRKEQYNYGMEKGRYEKYIDTDVHRAWLANNQADIDLYKEALVVFDIQLGAALRLYRDLRSNNSWVAEHGRQSAPPPHCKQYLS